MISTDEGPGTEDELSLQHALERLCWCALDSHICNDKTSIKMEKTKSWHPQIHWDFQKITVNHLTNRPKPRVCRRWYSSWFSSLRGKSLLSLLPVKRFWSPRVLEEQNESLEGTFCTGWGSLQFVTYKQLSYWNTLVSVQKRQPATYTAYIIRWDQYQPKRPEETIGIKNSSQSITEVGKSTLNLTRNHQMFGRQMLSKRGGRCRNDEI